MKRLHSAFLLAFSVICLSSTLSAQIISTIAGTGTAGYSGDSGPSTLAQVNTPKGVATDASGNIYFTDYENHRIRKINASTGVITTIAGLGSLGYTGDGGLATAAQLHWPIGIAIDAAGNIYFSDFGNNVIRKINTAGIISTIAGIAGSIPPPPPAPSYDGSAATTVVLGNPWGVAVDAAGNVYFADALNYRVRKITPAGLLYSVAGIGLFGATGDGGLATAARLNEPMGVAVDATGNLYIADYGNNRIRKVDPSGVITTFAGMSGPYGYTGDGGPATAARFYAPRGVAVDNSGNVFVCDWNNNAIRKINTSGIINTLAGTGTAGFSGDGSAPTSAEINHPTGVAIRYDGDVFIADVDNSRIRRIKIGNEPYFTWGATKDITICPAEFSFIDTVLRVDDIDVGQTETWSAVMLPANGTIVAAYTTTSTGSTMTPIGTSYAPFTGYTGPDSFSVRVTDGMASDTITIYVTVVPSPTPGVISGSDTVCPGHTIVLSETVTGGTWTSSNTATATVSATGVVAGIAAGSFTITYTVSNYCGSAYTIYPMRVLASVPCITSVPGSPNDKNNTLSITPNPNPGTFTVTIPAPTSETAHLEICDAVGRKVYSQNAPTNKAFSISLTEPNGIYFISVQTVNGKLNKKIFLNR